MDVQIGRDNSIQIKSEVFEEICLTLKKYCYETGGIIGTDKQGVISAFKFDKIQNPDLFEYVPNIEFLHRIINGDWEDKGISFAGFVHSHLNNEALSMQDVIYARDILKENSCLKYILIGVIDLSIKKHNITFYILDAINIYKAKSKLIIGG